MLKGMAILMMLFHHFFTKPENLTLIFFYNADACMRFAWLCKLCVATFAFVSGYGMMSSTDKNIKPDFRKLYKKAFSRIAGLYLVLWLIIILLKLPEFIITGAMPDAFELIMNALGLLYTYNGSWWYVFFYVLICLLLPVIVLTFSRQISIKKKLIVLVSIPAVFIIISQLSFNLLQMNSFFLYLFIICQYLTVALHPPIMLAFLAGAIICRFRLYERMLDIFKRLYAALRYSFLRLILKYILPVAAAMLICFIRIKIAPDAAYCKWDFIMVPVLIFIMLILMLKLEPDTACESTSALNKIRNIIKERNPLTGLLCFFGKYSTGMWLSHVLIMGYTYFYIAERTRLVVPFYIAEVLLSLIIAIAADVLLKFLKSLTGRFITHR